MVVDSAHTEVCEAILNMVAGTPTTGMHWVGHAMYASDCRLAGHASAAAAGPVEPGKRSGSGPSGLPWAESSCGASASRLALYKYEALLARRYIINSHNNHVWTDENPHATIKQRHQQISINASCCIRDFLIGP
jgi:hypothetical protein